MSWYTSTPAATAQHLADLFTRQTDIKVALFRSGGQTVLRRFRAEAAAGHVGADVLTLADPAAAAGLADAGAFVAFRPANFDKVPAAAKDGAGRYVAERLNVVGIVLRADQVPEPERPRSWADLVKPIYKGRMVMPDPAFTTLQLIVVATLSAKFGWDFYKGLRKDDVLVVKGHQQVSETLRSGKRAIAAEDADSDAFAGRKAGLDEITVFPAEGAFAIPAPTAVVKGGPHPAAAKAFARFLLSEPAQRLVAAEGFYGSTGAAPPPAGRPSLADIALLPVDYAAIAKHAAAIQQRFAAIFE